MERIKIANDTCKAEIQLSGAQMASFKGPDGREVMWQADPAVWPHYAPVLFPVCGYVDQDRIYIAGEKYPMKKHGFTRTWVFDVTRKGSDFVELSLGPNEENKPMYPFDFAFRVNYTLNAKGYTTTFIVENHDTKPMPFCVGGHPGFQVPMEAGAKFEDYQVVFDEVEDGKCYLTPGGKVIDGWEYVDNFHNTNVLPLNHALFDSRDALLFLGLKSRAVNLVHKDSGHGLRFEFPKLEMLAVWSMPNKNADYLCLEPWHGTPEQKGESGNFEDKAYVTILQPGECWQGGFTVTLI